MPRKQKPPPHVAIQLLHHSIIRDMGKSLTNLGINLLLGFVASLMMLHLHRGVYHSFESFMSGAISPDILMVLIPVSLILIGVEFLFLGLTPYEKGRVTRLFTTLILGVKDSIVVVSGLSMGMACATFIQNPYTAWSSFLIAMFYFAIAFFLAFICFAPFFTDLNGIKSRIAFIIVGVGFLLLAVYYPYLFSDLSWVGRWLYPPAPP